MTPQKPAEGIALFWENDDCRLYKVLCNCDDADHTAYMEINHDKDCDYVEVAFHTTQTTDFWSEAVAQSYDYKNEWMFEISYLIKRFVNSIGRRVMLTYDIWVKGQVNYQATTILTKQQALNVSAALTDSIEKFESSLVTSGKQAVSKTAKVGSIPTQGTNMFTVKKVNKRLVIVDQHDVVVYTMPYWIQVTSRQDLQFLADQFNELGMVDIDSIVVFETKNYKIKKNS